MMNNIVLCIMHFISFLYLKLNK